MCFLFYGTANTEICTSRHTLSLHDALPIWTITAISSEGNDMMTSASRMITWLTRGEEKPARRPRQVPMTAEMATAPAATTSVFCARSEEHTSELQSLMRISYAVCCMERKNNQTTLNTANSNITTLLG